MTSTQISVTPRATVRPLKVAGASLIGTAFEWYDYFIYGMAAAIVFGPLFFPSFSSIAGTLAAFATFSVGFIARPIGGVVVGHFGDRIGRKSMLVLSLMLMGGAVLMAVEHAPADKKGFYGSFPQMGVPGGLILANLVFLGVSTSLSEDAFLSWGWRVPFLASAAMVLMGLVIRFTITESPHFEKVESTHRDQRLPIVTVLRENLREVLLAAGAFIGINTVGYIFMAYLLSYSTKVLGMSKTLVLVFTLIASFVWLIVIPVASMLSDRYGRRRLLVTGSVGPTFWAAALFPLIDLGNPAVMMLALLGTAVFMGIVYGPIAALFTELFGAEVRYSGASLGYQIGSVLGGGLAPTVAAALYANWGSSAPITLYLTAVTLLSLLCVVAITRKVRGPLRSG
ncbi:MFS transporter [Rhodococcus sp. JVH1]|uniref:MFS transporter n=1 Tax=Rhodococcus sp. JVH1 TaxID=745408 RepID=UPI000271E9E1|nr:MFS transporter [Rhodococcus sp. JVH1]EJI99911.1 sugar (and other) transporter family protein [Rhodococcus sp. JVH1]